MEPKEEQKANRMALKGKSSPAQMPGKPKALTVSIPN